MQLFTEVLNHIISLGLSMYEKIKADSLLEGDNIPDFLLDEFLVLFLCDFTFAKFGSSETNLFGLLKC
jgi:hypothetical protein